MNLERVANHTFAAVEHTLTFRDSILYALGLGYGSEHSGRNHLQFVYEQDLQAVPSMCCVMGYPGFWLRDAAFSVDWVRLLHGEHYYEICSPLPTAGRLLAQHRVTGVDDKGPGRGATVTFEKALHDESGKLLARTEQTNFCRGDGGCGSCGVQVKERPALPDRAPDATHEIRTSRQIALIYRLSGDYNPVHADPDVARQAGFSGPWIAGMCSVGLATRATIERLCDDDPTRIRSMFVRFKNVCFPGETMRYEFFRTETGARFRTVCMERNVVVLDRGEVCFG
jgi:acyl dehydratase